MLGPYAAQAMDTPGTSRKRWMKGIKKRWGLHWGHIEARSHVDPALAAARVPFCTSRPSNPTPQSLAIEPEFAAPESEKGPQIGGQKTSPKRSGKKWFTEGFLLCNRICPTKSGTFFDPGFGTHFRAGPGVMKRREPGGMLPAVGAMAMPRSREGR